MLILDSLLRHSTERPHDGAAADLERHLDHQALREEAAAVAGGLQRRGVGPGDRVALHLPNSLDFLVAALACAWRGATFVPLAVAGPARRTWALLEDCRPALVVTAEGTDAEAAGVAGRPLASPRELRTDPGPVPPPAGSEEPAYVIYTSGTTGQPKGVVIGHEAFSAALDDLGDLCGLSPASRGMLVSPVHFDGSFATLFGVFHAGGFVLIPPRDALLFPRRFAGWVDEYDVDVTGFSPSYLRLLLAGRVLERLAAGPLRTLALGGEALVAADVLALQRAAPALTVVNRYGPTETTIAVTHHVLGAEDLVPGEPVPVGRPHPGVSFHLVDDGRLVTEPGRPGELWIGGDQLMDGYWGAPELTAEVLRSDVVPGETAYRTGDLAVSDAAGVYTCLDRLDRVIKRRGVRISLTEVGAALSAVPGVRGAAAVVYGAGPDTGIAAFVVAPGVSAEAVRAGGGARLPEDMLPDVVVAVASLPLTDSGKLDQRRLLREAGLPG